MEKLKDNPIILFAIVAFMVLLLAVFITQRTQSQPALDPYLDSKSSEEPSETEYVPDIETTIYQSETFDLSVLVPQGWVETQEEQTHSFFHKEDGASITINESAYYPEVNNVTANSLAEDVSKAGGQLLAFEPYNDQYLSKYVMDYVVYIEKTTWDLDTVVRITCSYPSESEEYYSSLFVWVVNSLTWNKPRAIPASQHIFYSQFGNFEVGIPITWETSIDEQGRLVAVSQNNSLMYCAVINDSLDVSNVTQEDFFSDIVNSETAYEVVFFDNQNGILSGEINYEGSDGQIYHRIQNTLQTDQYQYSFSMDGLLEYAETDSSFYYESLQLFRTF